MTAYCARSDVKTRLGITEVTWDLEIDGVINEATGRINAIIESYGVNTPISPIPDWLMHACANFAAALFQARRKDPAERDSVYVPAMNELLEILRTKFAPPQIRRI